MDPLIREAFGRVKKDMNQLREEFDSVLEAFGKKTDTKLSNYARDVNGLTASVEETLNNFTDKKDAEIAEIKHDVSTLSSRVESVIADFNERLVSLEKQIYESIDKATERLDSYSDRLIDMNSKVNKFQKRLDLVSGKLQEFDNMSVDIEDVEKSFVTKEEIKVKLSDDAKQKKDIRKTFKQLDKISNSIRDMEEKSQFYASSKDVMRNMEEIAELKGQLVLAEHLERIHERLDKMDSRIELSSKGMNTSLEKVDSSVADVISLKKDFVTKKQFDGQRKEIKLLVQGLKEVAKKVK